MHQTLKPFSFIITLIKHKRKLKTNYQKEQMRVLVFVCFSTCANGQWQKNGIPLEKEIQ